MLNFFFDKINSVLKLKIKYLLTGSIVIAKGKVSIGKNVKIKKSRIVVDKGSILTIGDDCIFQKVSVRLKGKIIIGNNNVFEQIESNVPLKINGVGNLTIGNFNRIRSRIWIRFNGNVEIGNYSNINERSEIRCDELIKIGSFCQMSYDITIWDTNTHNIYPVETRRKLMLENHPIYGFEYEKPKTKPIFIGNDCWLGKEVTILKGTIIEDKCVVGFRTLLSNAHIKENTTVYLDIKTKELKNEI